MVYVILWEFEAAPHARREFERLYGPNGAWAALFRQGEGFIDTELLRDPATAGRYVTVDRWETQAAFEAFRARHAAEYETIDQAGASLTMRETLIGKFEAPEPR